MTTKTFALNAFNAAVVLANTAHGTKRVADKAALKVRSAAIFAGTHINHAVDSGATSGKEAGIAFWAGLKYAHQVNVAKGKAADKLTIEDILASKPGASKKTRTVTKPRAGK